MVERAKCIFMLIMLQIDAALPIAAQNANLSPPTSESFRLCSAKLSVFSQISRDLEEYSTLTATGRFIHTYCLIN